MQKLITMSNALVRAGHGLTLAEKRIVMLAISSMDSRVLLDKHQSRIYATDYAKEFGVDAKTAYAQIKSTAKILYSRSITFYQASHKRNGTDIRKTVTTLRWVYQVTYNSGDGYIDIFWSPPILKFLTGLKTQFTSYRLSQANALRSAYTWRLMELLLRFKANGWAEYAIEDFCASMDAPDKYADNFARVRVKIIEPSVAELIEHEHWDIKWETITKGRRVIAVRFTFSLA